MEQWGNGRANAYYEANIPAGTIVPKEGDSVRIVEKFIRDKYEHKKYIAKTVPPKSAATEVVAEKPKRVAQASKPAPTVAATPIVKPVAVPTSTKAPAAEPSLLDFMDDSPAPASVPAVPVSAPAAQASGFDFVNANSFQSAPQPSNGFDAFSAPVS